MSYRLGSLGRTNRTAKPFQYFQSVCYSGEEARHPPRSGEGAATLPTAPCSWEQFLCLLSLSSTANLSPHVFSSSDMCSSRHQPLALELVSRRAQGLAAQWAGSSMATDTGAACLTGWAWGYGSVHPKCLESEGVRQGGCMVVFFLFASCFQTVNLLLKLSVLSSAF